jgi:hypothetical protein
MQQLGLGSRLVPATAATAQNSTAERTVNKGQEKQQQQQLQPH